MSIYHDGCTAGPLSAWLDASIGACCGLHDAALDHSVDLGTFVRGNIAFAHCVWAISPVLAVAALAVVSGPIGLGLYWFGPKRRDNQ